MFQGVKRGLACVTVVLLCQLSAKAQAAELDNTADKVRENWWNWTVFVKGTPLEIQKISCIVYHIDRTFHPSIVRVCNPGENPSQAFPLTRNGWGVFPVQADVETRNGDIYHLRHMLAFREHANVAENCPQTADQSARPDNCVTPPPKLPKPAVNTPTYRIRIHEFTAFRIVSHDNPALHQHDTVYVSLMAKGPNGTSGPVVSRAFDGVERNQHPKVDLDIDNFPVPHNADATLQVSWSLANKGTGTADEVRQTLTDATVSALMGSGNPTAVTIGAAIKLVNDNFFKSCDHMIGAGSITLNGNQIYNGYNGVPGDYDWNHVSPEQNDLPCSKDAHYNVNLIIERISG